MAKLIKANGQTSKVEPANGEAFTLEELQKVVDGYIEVIHLDNGSVLVVNEEGKLLGLPYNAKASASYDIPLVGDVLECKVNEIE